MSFNRRVIYFFFQKKKKRNQHNHYVQKIFMCKCAKKKCFNIGYRELNFIHSSSLPGSNITKKGT